MTDAPPLTKPGTNAIYSIDDQIREARRELKMRERVYWGRVERGQMTVEEMNRYTKLQKAIILTLEQVKAMHWPDKQGGLNV